jgi:hypothetical protein
MEFCPKVKTLAEARLRVCFPTEKSWFRKGLMLGTACRLGVVAG